MWRAQCPGHPGDAYHEARAFTDTFLGKARVFVMKDSCVERFIWKQGYWNMQSDLVIPCKSSKSTTIFGLDYEEKSVVFVLKESAGPTLLFWESTGKQMQVFQAVIEELGKLEQLIRCPSLGGRLLVGANQSVLLKPSEYGVWEKAKEINATENPYPSKFCNWSEHCQCVVTDIFRNAVHRLTQGHALQGVPCTRPLNPLTNMTPDTLDSGGDHEGWRQLFCNDQGDLGIKSCETS